jgi:hypothetical protein
LSIKISAVGTVPHNLGLDDGIPLKFWPVHALAVRGLVGPQLVEKAIKDLGVHPEKVQPQIV